MFKIECSVITYTGPIRENNEDNYYVNGKYKIDSKVDIEGYIDNAQRDSYLYAVYDGLGGDELGEVASIIAAWALEQFQSTDIRKTIGEYVQYANKFICDEIEKNDGIRIGTTFALLSIRNNKAIAYNIGDSRVYLYRDEDLYLMTEDHTLAQRLVRMGMLDHEEAVRHKSKNRLTQHLGIFPEELKIAPYMSEEVEILRGDMFLLCTDGLTDMVSDDDIVEILSSRNWDTTALVKQLASDVQANGGRDNATMIIVKVV